MTMYKCYNYLLAKLMYRPSNERYSDNNPMVGMGSYPPQPHHDMPKMHGHIDPNYQSMPIFYDNSQPNYDYLPPNNNPPPESYDPRYPGWRDTSEPKNHMIIQPMGNPPPTHYRPMAPPSYHEQAYAPPRQAIKPSIQPQDNFSQAGPTSTTQVNVVQRISGIIKSQLSYLQSTMIYADKKTHEQRMKKERSRSRSRDRGGRSSREREREHRHSHREHHQWNCAKCNFLNFDFRDRCKRCNDTKPEAQSKSDRSEGITGKNYVPGPDDWRCNKCNNINYARRIQCHRCHTPRSK